MAKIIAIANQKGGVGKTTTCVNLCAALHRMGRRVLLVDCDPQGNASSGMGVSKTCRPNTYDLLVGDANAADCVVHTDYGDLIPTGKELAAASVELIQKEKREFVLKAALLTLYTDYDYILIDCPPSLELLTVNALVAADSVLIPMQCEYYALEGLADLMTSIKMANQAEPEAAGGGILLTMYDGRMNLTIQVADELRRHLGEKVYKTVIPRSIRLSEAPSHGVPGVIYDRQQGQQAYLALAGDFLARRGGKKHGQEKKRGLGTGLDVLFGADSGRGERGDHDAAHLTKVEPRRISRAEISLTRKRPRS